MDAYKQEAIFNWLKKWKSANYMLSLKLLKLNFIKVFKNSKFVGIEMHWQKPLIASKNVMDFIHFRIVKKIHFHFMWMKK